MCGRYTLFLEVEDVLTAFDLDEVLTNWVPKYNVAPSQPVLAVTEEKPRAAVGLKWGIDIHSAQANKDVQLINIRAETILEKGHFRRPRYQPCLILANGFYEWRKDAGKQPYYFFLKGHQPFMFAGLWTTDGQGEGQAESKCAILTCPPNPLVGTVHNRMPVILDKSQWGEWLKAKTPQEYQKFLKAYPPELMECHPVGKLINSPAVDSAACVAPLERLF